MNKYNASAVRRFQIVRDRLESSERILHTESIAECLISSARSIDINMRLYVLRSYVAVRKDLKKSRAQLSPRNV